MMDCNERGRPPLFIHTHSHKTPNTSIPQNGLPSPSVPVIGGRFWTIAGRSLSVVLVAFMEAFAIGRKYALSEGYPLHVNRVRLRRTEAAESVFSPYSH